MPLPEDWRAFIESLNSNGVEYVVVGAVALAHHGIPRYTGDLEILICNSDDNARRVESTLVQFGFGELGRRRLLSSTSTLRAARRATKTARTLAHWSTGRSIATTSSWCTPSQAVEVTPLTGSA
jgi:hypothetical protein